MDSDASTKTIHDYSPVPDVPVEPTVADCYAEIVAIRNDIQGVVNLVTEVGPTLAMLMEEAQAKGLAGLLPLLMSLRKG